MSVINGKPSSMTVEPDRIVSATPEPYKGVVVDSQVHPTDLFTTFVGGYPISVDYYAQRYSSQEGTKDYQSDLDAVYQPLTLIRGMQLMVDSPIDRSQDTQSKDFTIQGSANVYNVFRPTEGDVFRYDIGDGNEFLFMVTTSERKTENSRSVTAINYKAIHRMDQRQHEIITERVVETLYFSLENLRRGMQPLLRTDQVETRNKLERHYATLLDLYLNRFYSRNERTLLVPSQQRATYDPFLTMFMVRIIGSDEHPMISGIETLDVHSRQIMYNKTLWSVLETLDGAYLNHVSNKMGLVSTKDWKGGPSLGGIFYSRVEFCVYPDDDMYGVDADYNREFKSPIKPFTDVSNLKRTISSDIRQLNLNGFGDTIPIDPLDPVPNPLYRHVLDDDGYVLSQSFYKGTVTSVLESCVLDAIAGKQIQLQSLDALCTAAADMNKLDQFYIVPILLALIRIHPRGF